MAQTKQLRILMVEDDGGIAQVIKIAMRDLDFPYLLDHAYTAEEALELWQQTGYDLVLTDYNLRGTNGLDLISRLKEQGARVPIVLVTAYDTPALRRQAEQAGIAKFVAKPFFVDQFIDLVRDLLPIQSSQIGM
ncbi:MAG: response regulator [Roseiflexaceae bacterium]|nr:response regulator [Roseiflexaceae bacterium]